jgi:hypothetical protein
VAVKVIAVFVTLIGLFLALIVGAIEEHDWAVVVGIIVYAAGFSFPLWAHYII